MPYVHLCIQYPNDALLLPTRKCKNFDDSANRGGCAVLNSKKWRFGVTPPYEGPPSGSLARQAEQQINNWAQLDQICNPRAIQAEKNPTLFLQRKYRWFRQNGKRRTIWVCRIGGGVPAASASQTTATLGLGGIVGHTNFEANRDYLMQRMDHTDFNRVDDCPKNRTSVAPLASKPIRPEWTGLPFIQFLAGWK